MCDKMVRQIHMEILEVGLDESRGTIYIWIKKQPTCKKFLDKN